MLLNGRTLHTNLGPLDDVNLNTPEGGSTCSLTQAHLLYGKGDPATRSFFPRCTLFSWLHTKKSVSVGHDQFTEQCDLSCSPQAHDSEVDGTSIGAQRGSLKTGFFRSLRRHDGYSKGWRPFSITAPILTAIVVVNLLLITSIELLAQKSRHQGGLGLSPRLEDIPGYIMMAYLYLPNTIAVLYSLLWTWVDHDVKRMQPWFEVSKPSGALARDSLFLDYSNVFVAAVPFKAARRRHWPVFLAGLTMVVVLWAITPLQSAVFATSVILKNETVTIKARSQLVPVQEQAPLLDTRIMTTAYAVGWLGQAMPPFTSREYALLPFAVDDTSTGSVSGIRNYTAKTTKFSTELECQPAEIKLGPAAQAFISNGQGCNASLTLPLYSNYTMLYVGYWSSPYSDYALAGESCKATSSSVHQFAAVWAKGDKENPARLSEHDVTSIFCQPHYYKQEVSVKVSRDTLKPYDESVRALAPKQRLTANEINITAFEFLLSNGIDSNPNSPRDGLYAIVVDQGPRTAPLGLKPSPNMVGFALAGQNRSMDDYRDGKLLQETYNRAHQYIFSIATSYLWENTTVNDEDLAVFSFELSGIIVSRTISAVVEALLLVTAVFALIILGLVRKAPCVLQANPSSISRLMDVFRASPDVVDIFQKVDYTDEEELQKHFQHDRYRAVRNPNSTSSTDAVIIQRIPGILTPKTQSNDMKEGYYYRPIKPLALRLMSGVLFIAVIAGAIATLSYLKDQETKARGLQRPANNFDVLQILENYVPTIFATLVEPFWILLNRLLCALQPFKDLWKGKSKPDSSIKATYSAVPPQMVFFRAIKKKHFILTLVCTMALMSNVLAVALGALFNEKPITISEYQVAHSLLAPRFRDSEVWNLERILGKDVYTSPQYQDHFYIVLANITKATPLPPWTTEEYYFGPLALANNQTFTSTDRVHLATRGYGLKPCCQAYPVSTIPRDATVIDNLNTTMCSDEMLMNNAGARMRQNTNQPTAQPVLGLSSIEYLGAIGANPCNKALTFSWARTSQPRNVNASATASYLVCRPVFQTAIFNLTVDMSGNVLSYRATSRLSETLDYPESRNHTDSVTIISNFEMMTFGSSWHNDSFSQDWLNYLLYASTGSRRFLDPHQPAPDSEELKPTVEKIYRSLFSVLLSRNQLLFESANPNDTVEGTRLIQDTRIFIENPALTVTYICLGLNIIAAALFYTKAVVFVLPRMPTTIGSVLAYVASSRAMSGQYRDLGPGPSRTFSFGRFKGRDGKVHLGVEMDPHVVPIDPSLLDDTDNGIGRRLLRKVWKKDTARVGAWI